MKYQRNWAWDTPVEVKFQYCTIAGTGTTDNKGRLIRVEIHGAYHETPFDTLKDMGATTIDFTTPAKLTL